MKPRGREKTLKSSSGEGFSFFYFMMNGLNLTGTAEEELEIVRRAVAPSYSIRHALAMPATYLDCITRSNIIHYSSSDTSLSVSRVSLDTSSPTRCRRLTLRTRPRRNDSRFFNQVRGFGSGFFYLATEVEMWGEDGKHAKQRRS
jgi:hypothetical protein